jgi:pimeloyl-ACP methyl ester carboxylesterase
MRRLAYGVALGIVSVFLACTSRPSDDAGQEDPLQLSELPIRMTQIQAGVFDQEIDHPLDGSPSLGTFKQRYWVNTEFAQGPDSPTILYFCGESPCSAGHIASMGDVAKTLHARVVGLEHRYYGQSIPYPDLLLEHMKYLTIHNALEDAANFQRFAQEKLGFGGKWLSVGGSYPGMLSAFYRLKHPELVAGAWASSAPVDVQKTFWGGDAIAAKTLGPTCTTLVQQALVGAGEMYDDPVRRPGLILAVYKYPYPQVERLKVVYGLSGHASNAVQRGTTRALCAALQQHAERPIDGLLAYLNPPLVPDEPDAGTPPAGDASAPTDTEEGTLGPPDVDPPPAPGTFYRGQPWLYQTCTEVGFFAVGNPDRSLSLKPEGLDESYFDRQCDQYVGRRPDIARTRAEYFEPIASGKATNIYFVNGTQDPWSALSFTQTAPAGTSLYVVQEGQHCEDMRALQQNSLLGDFEARLKFHDLAKTWLSQ